MTRHEEGVFNVDQVFDCFELAVGVLLRLYAHSGVLRVHVDAEHLRGRLEQVLFLDLLTWVALEDFLIELPVANCLALGGLPDHLLEDKLSEWID